MNGVLLAEGLLVNEYTVPNLTPETDYLFHFIARSKERSNTVKITTTNSMNNFLDKLLVMLEDLFISDDFQIDSNNDGVSDGMQDTSDKIDGIISNTIISFPGDIGDIIGVESETTLDGSLDDLPSLEVELIPGQPPVEMLPWEEFAKEIKLIRRLLVACLYSWVIFYLIKLVIPKLGA